MTWCMRQTESAKRSATRAVILFAERTHGTDVSPNGALADLFVTARLSHTHVEHTVPQWVTPCGLHRNSISSAVSNPSGALMSWKSRDNVMSQTPAACPCSWKLLPTLPTPQNMSQQLKESLSLIIVSRNTSEFIRIMGKPMCNNSLKVKQLMPLFDAAWWSFSTGSLVSYSQ